MAKWTIYLEGGPRRVNHAAVAIRNTIYSFGGYCSGEVHDQLTYIDIHALDTTTYRWHKVVHSNITCDTTMVEIDEEPEPATSDDVPYQRYGHTVVAYKDKAYVWGGRNDEHGASNVMHEFEPFNRRWRKVKVEGLMPPARDGHTAVVVGHHMVVFGGFEEELQRFSQETYVFDFDTCKWTELATSNTPPMWRDFHTAAAIGTKMYVFGGRSDQNGQVGDDHDLFHSTHDLYDDSLMALDLLTGVWEKVIPKGKAPGGRRSHSAWVYNGRMYMFGGYLGTKNIHYNELYCFDPVLTEWFIVPVSGKFPSARRRHCTVVVADRVFLFGGTMPSPKLCYPMSIVPTVLSASGLSDLSDLHVLDYSPTLKQLSMLNAIQMAKERGISSVDMFDGFKHDLPVHIRRDMFFSLRNNELSTNAQPRNEALG